MPQADWDALERDVRDLARRVVELEAHLGLSANGAERAAVEPDQSPSAAPSDAASILPIAGRALLGLAGAYLLRSLTGSSSISPRAGVTVGILYAMAWLVWAARTPASKPLEAAIHSLTSVLILSPLLWESSVTMRAVPAWMAAAMLLAFGIFSLAVSWQKDLLIVATIATLAVLGTSGALLLATHDIPPFTTVFLVMAASVECSACLNHWLNERWFAAAAADLSVLLATWLATNPRGLPETYAPIPLAWLIGAQVALLAIYLVSTIIRTLCRGFTFTGFEIAQSAVAFAIVLNGVLRLSTTNPRLAPAIGTLTLAIGLACYLVSFLRLDHPATSSRNFYTYSTFAVVLVLAGTRILFPEHIDIPWYGFAVVCAGAGRLLGRMTLAVHATAFLLLALVSSGAALNAGGLLLGSTLWQGAGQPGLWMGALAAALAYVLTIPTFQIARLAMAAAAAGVWAGIAAGSLTAGYHYMFGPATSLAYCATLRTTVLAGAALLLAWAASRWKHAEFTHLIYAAMILGAYRLVTQDLHEEKAALFLSLLVYGAALTALPRIRKAAS